MKLWVLIPHGLSSRLRYIDYLNENTRIRLDNGQNKIIVWIIHFLRLFKKNFLGLLKNKKIMNILITGCAGFIGFHLSDFFYQKNKEFQNYWI